MSHSIVVWEYESEGQWLPHTPGVSRALERAHAKQLTRVVLADADPALRGHHVNLLTLTQCQDTAEGGPVERAVRRACYPAGAGRARWEWARLVTPRHALQYQPMPMEFQCLLESAWCGGQEAVWWEGWAASAARGTARRGPDLRLLRRLPQPPYPRDPPSAPAPAPRIPHQHTGSSVQSVNSAHSVLSTHSVNSAHSAQSAHSAHSAPARAGARSASPRDRKPGLARQILHNLNIFSNSKQPAAEQDSERESETEEARGRRHSVDTVSTYLSHESKDSLQRGSVSSVLNCSGGSDDVFDSPDTHTDHNEQDVGVAGVSGVAGLPAALARCVVAAPCAQWGALCAACVRPLADGAAVALRCHHAEHIHCLRRRAALMQDPLETECLVCGAAVGPSPAPAPAAPAPSQPPGSMAWRLQHVPLPQFDTHTSILVTYNFQSGRQSAEQPAPGAPYYAVGFPRHSLLPDTPLGRQVLSALRAAWERRVLFTVCASQTTGREHVVAWRVAPPPAAPAHYAPPAHPARLLLAALSRLQGLLHTP